MTVVTLSPDPAADPSSTPAPIAPSADIFQFLGAEDLPEEEKIELLAKMATLVRERVFNRIVDDMTPEASNFFDNEVAESEDPQAFDLFLERFVPNYQVIVDDEINKLRQQLSIRLAE